MWVTALKIVVSHAPISDFWRKPPVRTLNKRPRELRKAHVAVPCVAIHPSTILFPVSQSLALTDSDPPNLVPNINDPPRKHTRWSCFGDSIQGLTPISGSKTIASTISKGNSLSVWPVVWKQLNSVSQPFCQTLFDQPIVYRLHRPVVHLLWAVSAK